MTASKDPFEALAECTDAIVFVTDVSMRMLYASSMLELQTGFTAADFQFQQTENPFIHREDSEQVAEHITAFLASEASVSPPIVNRFLDRWGRVHRYRSVLTKIDYAGLPALLFVCRVLETPQARETDDRQYRALVESADDAIVRLDNAGRFLFANRRMHEMLGYSAVDLGRLRFDDLLSPRDAEVFSSQLTRTVGAPGTLRFEIRVTAKDGHAVHVQASLTSLGRFGQAGELLAVLREVTATPATE